jgi:hypothetical protein
LSVNLSIPTVEFDGIFDLIQTKVMTLDGEEETLGQRTSDEELCTYISAIMTWLILPSNSVSYNTPVIHKALSEWRWWGSAYYGVERMWLWVAGLGPLEYNSISLVCISTQHYTAGKNLDTSERIVQSTRVPARKEPHFRDSPFGSKHRIR